MPGASLMSLPSRVLEFHKFTYETSKRARDYKPIELPFSVDE